MLHRIILDDIVTDFGVELAEDELVDLNLAWHRLDPWPDTVSGLNRLKTGYKLCTLSNGNLSLLANMAKRAALPWDLILSAEVFRAYKPDREAYLGVADTFDIDPAKVMLVAAHQYDLDAAREHGLGTAYIERPLEFGTDRIKDISGDDRNDIHARDFNDLADQLVG